jgi:macrolide transport system ATP-binding/permease protein
LIALGGGVIGILVGTELPLSLQFFVEGFRIPVSGWSVIIAFSVSSAVGLVFGWMPANRASKLSPVDALRHE